MKIDNAKSMARTAKALRSRCASRSGQFLLWPGSATPGNPELAPRQAGPAINDRGHNFALPMPARRPVGRPAAFTLIELLVALAILATAMAITFSTFYSISRAWQRGLAMADDLDHGEFLMEQLVRGLRSAFYPEHVSESASSTNTSTNTPGQQTNTSATASNSGASQAARVTDYGLILNNNGTEASARASLSWVKTGPMLLGPDNPLAKTLHRVCVAVEDDPEGRPVAAVRAWRPYCNLDSFSPDDVEPFYISGKVLGLYCQVSTNRTDDGWEWQDAWENDATNHLPLAVKLTLYLEPLEPGDPPVTVSRLVEIPVGPISWIKPKKKKK